MYRALIVCNSRFPEGRGILSDLQGPKKDGILLRDALTDHATGMFDKSEVRNLPEEKSREIVVAIEELFGTAEPDDILLFYYSGHGLTRNQQLFLCAQDTNVDKLFGTAIPGGNLKEIVASSVAQAKILILDCCYSAMFKGDEIIGEFAGEGRYVLAATSATERASDGRRRGQPSPFTEALVNAIHSQAADRDGDGQVDLDDVYNYLNTVTFDGARPHRNFDGAGAVPIARRAITPPKDNGRLRSPSADLMPEGLPSERDAAIYAIESAQPDLPYLDRTVSGASFSQNRVDAFRAEMRSDIIKAMPATLLPTEFLRQAGLMRHGRLTYGGLLLFGENPTIYLSAAVVQCVRFHGTSLTAPLESIDLQGSVPELIVKARDFIAALARTGELPTADGAYAEATYRYPMIAVREIIANAVVHRDYSDQESSVQIHAYDDRIEIISPGKWVGAPVTEPGEHPIGQLERRSQKRNFRLAQALTWSKLVEGVGTGVSRSIADCESNGAPEPVVVTDEHMVQVTIFPRPERRFPASVELALRLRNLRTQHWTDSALTQAMLAKALGKVNPLTPATIAAWESRTAPRLPPRERLAAYAQFFATRRSLEPEPTLVSRDSFTQEEQAAYQSLLDELLRLRSAVLEDAALESAPAAIRQSWRFTDSGPLTLISAQLPQEQSSALADQRNPNYTRLTSFADLDAMMELYGHIRAENPSMGVYLKDASSVYADDLSGHVVLVGSTTWNDVTRRLTDLTRLPIRQIADPAVTTGEIFEIQAGGAQQKFLPRITAEGELIEDVGLIVRMPNPLNSNRTLTMCNGIHSRGVLGAVRTLTDAGLRDSNEQYLEREFPESGFGVLMRVQVIEGETLTPDFHTAGTVLYQWPVKA